MALDDNKGTLWFDEWVWLDNDSGSQASAWRLPPEKWLNLGNTVRAQFIFDYWSIGPGGADVNIGIEQCPLRTMDNDAWSYMVSPGQISLFRLSDSIGRIVGQDGSPFDAYPRGWARVLIDNGSATDWAAVRVRCHVRLETA